MNRILVIKLSALGDVVQAFGPFAAIRAHHPDAHITLLTTPPFAALLEGSPWFDAIRADGRPGWGNIGALLRLARGLGGAGFSRVYDLQTSGRSSRYRWFVPGAEWSGIARGASHPHANPARDAMHTLDRQREQLEMAGIRHFPAPDLSWLDADLSRFRLPTRFALMVPGASAARPGKRWPVERFAKVAMGLGMPSVVVGGPSESGLAAAIPGALDLCGKTSLRELGAIARRAALCVGNDTGPTHLAAACGTPTLAIFGEESDPALCAPRGPAVSVLRGNPIGAVSAAAALAALPYRP
ncbi:glycosyltransferase family 9 protein [Sabulicella rubraurantiaca]|uniref:glycosyltransferase family 9 protein n=1 Tax=Sabulicella rubraurantiaca TaxID=2811429 RepID=UPI001A95BC33|nr:glycosyltransferase family 9 protein [Sabulicella rubraurantiaca]